MSIQFSDRVCSNLSDPELMDEGDAGQHGFDMLGSKPEYASLPTMDMGMTQMIVPSLLNQQPDASKERARINARLANFDWRDNIAWTRLKEQFGGNIKQPELLSVAEVIAKLTHLKVDRDAKRRKTVLVKWFCEHWDTIKDQLDKVVLDGGDDGDRDQGK